MMKNNKGQALVEFIIIIPVLIFILFALIDFGNIVLQKYKLEDNLDVISELYLSNDNNSINTYLTDTGIKASFEKKDKYTTIKVEKEVTINTIILNNILGNKYKISTDKIVLNGDNQWITKDNP